MDEIEKINDHVNFIVDTEDFLLNEKLFLAILYTHKTVSARKRNERYWKTGGWIIFFLFGVFFCRWWNIVNLQLIQIKQGFTYSIWDTGIFVNILWSTNQSTSKNKKKKNFFERLTEIYTLTQWKFCYFEWILKKMDELNHMVDPTPFIDKDNASLDYLVHLTDYYNLFSCDWQRFLSFFSSKWIQFLKIEPN